jgi:hypothetical protein
MAQLCTRGCDPNDLASCQVASASSTTFSCQQAALENPDGTASTSTIDICFPSGGGAVGATCTFGPAACKSHYCLKKDSGNVCTAKCTAADAATVCPTGWNCSSVDEVGGGSDLFCVPSGVGQ